MIYEIRLYLHTIFLDWALSIMPVGRERLEFLDAIIPYMSRHVEHAKKRGGEAA